MLYTCLKDLGIDILKKYLIFFLTNFDKNWTKFKNCCFYRETRNLIGFAELPENIKPILII